MSIPKLHFLFPSLAALVIFAGGCHSTQSTAVSARPARQANAPTLAALPAPSARLEGAARRQADAVDALVENSEREYQAGKANLYVGNLEGAKQNFDRATSMLMQGPVDVHSDERLQGQFDRIVEGSQELEAQTAKEGEDSTDQKAEPAPIDEANDVVFPVDPQVKQAAEAELKATHSDLPLVMNDYVAGYINYYATSGRSVLEGAWTRAGRYRAMIERIFKEEGVPQDLLYLAQAESGFHPLALSRAGARGMWQFMGQRAKGYGLTRNWWIDERQDPEKATRAAARHLKDLFKQFGDWYLAMAAYNSGPGNVQQAVRRTGFADFWELYKRGVLPRETKNYVPIIVAITIMAKNPAQYGLENIQPEEPPKFDMVKLNYPVDLRLVAQCLEVPVESIRELNPSLLRMTTPRSGGFELKVPEGGAEKYHTGIAAIPVDKRVWWRYHKVSAGDTLTSIARQYHTTAKSITEVNGLSADEVTSDTKLIIPIAPGKNFPGGMGAMYFSRHATRYRVRSGDTVLTVADEFGVPPEKLRRWNGLKGNSLRWRRVLVIYRPVAEPEAPLRPAKSKGKPKPSSKLPAAADSGQRLYKVQPGDTLYSIANAHGTSVAALRRDNRRTADTLHPGDILVIK